MNIAELEAIVSGGESEQVEFKKTTGQKVDGTRTACAMLNGRGGFVLYGVTDVGEICGQDVTTRTLEEVAAELRKIEPQVLLDVDKVALDSGRHVVAVRVPSGASKPYTYDGRAYVRQGPTTMLMEQSEYRRLLLVQMHPTDRWENQPAHQLTVGDLDAAEITRTVDEAIRRGRLDEPGTRDPEALLQGLGLIRDGILLNAAVVLFAKEERLLPFYPQCLLRMARFVGVTTAE